MQCIVGYHHYLSRSNISNHSFIASCPNSPLRPHLNLLEKTDQLIRELKHLDARNTQW